MGRVQQGDISDFKKDDRNKQGSVKGKKRLNKREVAIREIKKAERAHRPASESS